MYVLVKVVRAKHTGPWEGGGNGGKKHTQFEFFLQDLLFVLS